MANTIREQIISAYATRLASWTTANSYNYNCGASVKRAATHVQESDLPAVVIWPQLETNTDEYGQHVLEMTVKIEAMADISTYNRSVVQEKLLGDAIKIMTDPSVEVSSLIDEISYIGGGPQGAEQPEDQITGIQAEFKIKYKTLLGNPYTQ